GVANRRTTVLAEYTAAYLRRLRREQQGFAEQRRRTEPEHLKLALPWFCRRGALQHVRRQGTARQAEQRIQVGLLERAVDPVIEIIEILGFQEFSANRLRRELHEVEQTRLLLCHEGSADLLKDQREP